MEKTIHIGKANRTSHANHCKKAKPEGKDNLTFRFYEKFLPKNNFSDTITKKLSMEMYRCESESVELVTRFCGGEIMISSKISCQLLNKKEGIGIV